MADYLGAGTLVDDIPVKPEESFATKALKMGQSHASHFMQGGLDFADKLQPLPNIQRPNLFGTPEPSTNLIASATEEIAYDVGSMLPMTLLGTMMGGPAGGAAGAGLGLLKGLYKFGKLDTLATGLKHGAKALGAPEWLQETIKLGTQLVQPIFGTAKKILGMKQPAYAQSRELSQGAELDSFAYKNALANKVRKVRVKAGRGSDLLNAIIEDMETLGEDKSKVYTGERPSFKIKVHDALDRKIGLNELYQDIEKGQKTVTYGKNADGTPRHFTVTEGVKEGVAELNSVLREHIINPYTQINPEFGEAFGVAEGIHKGESAFLAAKENLSKNKSWKCFLL